MSQAVDPFEALLAEHLPRIDRILAGYERDPERRRDLRQDVALAIWRALPGFRGDASLGIFVGRIAQNVAVDHVRKMVRASPAAPIGEAEGLVSDIGQPFEEAASASETAGLQRAVASLPLGQRQAVILHLEDMSHAEIARTLGISEGAVAVRLHRASACLAQRMGHR